MLVLITVLVAVLCLMIILYSCGKFWLGSRYSPHGPIISPHVVEGTQRPTRIITEATYISVWYRTDEVRTSTSTPVAKKDADYESESEDDRNLQTDPGNGTASCSNINTIANPCPSTSTSFPTTSSAKPKVETGGGLSLHLDKLKRIDAIQEKQKLTKWKSEDLGCDLLIAVDASKTQIGGYCLNLKTKVCEFYSYDIERLPWEMRDEKTVAAAAIAANPSGLDDVDDDPDVTREYFNELHSKNLVFALLLWEDNMKENKQFKLYTSNDASTRWPESKYGRRVREILTHLEDCVGLYKCNTMIVLEEDGDLEKYVRFMLPAKNLSNMGIKTFTEYIAGAYGVERFEGTHEYVRDETVPGKSAKKALYMSTKYFESFLMKVKKGVTNHKTNNCAKCEWDINKSASLESIKISENHSKVKPGRPTVKKTVPGAEDQIVTGRAPPTSSGPKILTLNRKDHKVGFPTLQWNRKNRNSGNSNTSDRKTLPLYSKSKGQQEEGRSCSSSSVGSPRSPSAPPQESSEDCASISSKGTTTTDQSDGYSTSKSTYSSKGTLALR